MSLQQFPQPERPATSSLAALAAARPPRHAPSAAPAPQPAAPPPPAPQLGPALRAVRGNELEYFPTQWVWPGRIACAKLTLIGGAPGTGKSTLIMRMAAAVTTGAAWPCGEGTAPRGTAMLVCPDGDPDTIVPRLRAAGADLARVQIIREVAEPGGPRPFDLAKDLALLEATAAGIEDLALIAFDALPLAAGRGAARDNGVLLQSLAALAERANAAIVAVAHLPGADHLTRRPPSLASLPLSAARAAFAIEIDPADEQRRLILQVKNELAADPGTLAFRITAHENEPDESAARASFEPQRTGVSPAEFTARQSRSFNSAKAEAIEFLRDLFGKAMQVRVRHIEHEARGAGLLKPKQGLSQCRALRDARLALGLKVAREGFGKDGAWVWAKPGAREEKQTPAAQPKSGQPGKPARDQVAPDAEPHRDLDAPARETPQANLLLTHATEPLAAAGSRPTHALDLQPTARSESLGPADRKGEVMRTEN
jgi:hypothetical protein